MKDRRARPRFKPGEVVAQSGIYRVYHNRHRLMHEATLLEQARFPRCKVCKNEVRFVLRRPLHSKDVLPFRPTQLLEECDDPSDKAS